MTIVADTGVQTMPWRGYDDPRFPEAVWWGSTVVVGDASGGTMNARIIFKDEGQLVSGNIWNLEELNAFVNDDDLRNVFMVANGLAPQRNASFVDRQYGLELRDTGSSNSQAALAGGRGGDQMLKLPTMLGTVRGVQDDIAALVVGLTNAGVTVSLSITAMGYQWGPRSVMAEGGPQRPPLSIFGG